MTANPSASFAEIWKSVVAELNGDLGGTTTLTAQQRAWLRMVQPLVLTEGFALLSVPTQFVQNEIERHLREPIIAALSRHLGQRVDLGVRIAVPDGEDRPAPSESVEAPEPEPLTAVD
ncbi:MAG: chromosomal replication initiation protein DnaA, partial [Actinobacteria bacterium]|nr:chromosomal replication initiation protein DnaA [Actinomycetota bacterium]